MNTYKRYGCFSSGVFTGLIEVWRDINGYEGLYQVSSFGRIKSLARFRQGKSNSTVALPERIMKPKVSKSGYLVIGLCKDGSKKHPSIHRLVAIAFVPNPQDKPTVNHKNSVKTDNGVSNLEWSTHSEQMQHAVENDLIEKRGAPKLTKLEKRNILLHHNCNPSMSIKALADHFKISERTASRIVKDGVSVRTTTCRTKSGLVRKEVRSNAEVQDMIAMRDAGSTLRQIGLKYNLGTSQVWRICKKLSRDNNYEE